MEAQRLTTALKAENAAGMTIPWVWTRRQLAQRWGVPPWVVDRVPHQEVYLELRLMSIEHEAEAFRRKHGR